MDQARKNWLEVEWDGQEVGMKPQRRVTCRHCHQTLSAKIERITLHLASCKMKPSNLTPPPPPSSL